jgi:hypothetical protein
LSDLHEIWCRISLKIFLEQMWVSWISVQWKTPYLKAKMNYCKHFQLHVDRIGWSSGFWIAMLFPSAITSSWKSVQWSPFFTLERKLNFSRIFQINLRIWIKVRSTSINNIYSVTLSWKSAWWKRWNDETSITRTAMLLIIIIIIIIIVMI